MIYSYLCKKVMKNVQFIEKFDFLKLLLDRPVDRAWLSIRHFQNQNKNKNFKKIWISSKLEEMQWQQSEATCRGRLGIKASSGARFSVKTKMNAGHLSNRQLP